MTRQKQRKTVFQLIYSLNYQGLDQKDTILETYYSQREEQEMYPYITDTFNGVIEHWAEINEMIEPALTKWKMKRLSAVCLAVLRLAVYELKFNPDIPDRVAVNEAIELAKEFGDEDSGSFVHGVLGNIAK
ncbi:MAG: transcription antitermination factor NusB [Clostridia bacterium]|nr:transcription antitermination factor NusB [Clostridia bacterium]